MRVVIAGAGIFGTTAAVELARRGHQVSLLDPGPLPHPRAASTDTSKIVRLEYGADVDMSALAEQALELWRAWGPPRFHPAGVLYLRGENDAFERSSAALVAARGHALEELSCAELARRFPAFDARPYAGALWSPEGGWAAARMVVEHCLEEAASLGVTILSGQRWAGIDSMRQAADLLIVAAGAWTSELVPEMRSVLSVRAQPVMYFRAARPVQLPVWAADIANTGWYGFPAAPDGTYKVAHHGAGFPCRADDARDLPASIIEGARRFLAGTLPFLASAELAAGRLCLYSDTADGRFWIDHAQNRPGLLLACGDSGHAFKFAPILGGLIADAAEGRPHPLFARRSPASGRGDAARSPA